ncbi:type VI secretion system protein [Magnetospirillum sp. 64-120]|uniref:type VI secretion system protein n=1 Tax=Magnetospirillum sp. 64-120 TaxID=1895778 RepID=UPI000926F2A4|nr:type VI secretion system protein [Magnetospirillum sp. 64-120]OJX81054.1 MAG: hypothetical protein BGO92_08245 [Magnetospirillum sp. 64-120]
MNDAPPFFPWVPWVIAALLLLAIIVVVVLLWRRLRATDTAPAPEAAEEPDAPEDSRWLATHMRREVRKSLDTLRQLSDSGGNPYSVPWIVALGAEGAQTRELIDAIDPDRPTAGGVIPRAGSMNFCRNGAVFHASDTLAEVGNGLGTWRRLIHLMDGCRPHRPLDGLVIALPASMLLGPDALPFDRIADRGGRFGEMIAAAQRITGLRVPVTLVITGCQELPGFSSLVSALPESALDDALGWANPYALDSSFQPEWTDQAIEHMATSLSGVAIQLLMTGIGNNDPDGLLLLPSQVRQFVSRLKPLLAAMFQPSAYHEAFLFRGIYMAGARPGRPGHGAFVSGLFNEKIFREYQLVRPVKGLLTKRTRRLRLAQAALAAIVAVSFAGLMWLRVDIPTRADKLRLLLATIHTDLTHRVKAEGREDPDFAQAAAIRLLQEMARLDVLTLTSPLAPTSYVRNPDHLMEQALAVGFDNIIIAEVGRRMTARLTSILGAPPPSGTDEGAVMGELNGFLDRLAEFDRIHRMFQNLPKLRSAAALETVANYALQIQLPNGFQERAVLYQNAMGMSTVPSSDAIASTLSRSLREHFFSAFRARFDDAGLLRRLERINHLSQVGENHDPDAALAQINELREQLEGVERDLNSRDYGWINGEGTYIGPTFDAALTRLDGLSLVDNKDIAAIRQMGEKQILEARKALFTQLAADRLPLLHLENGKAVLSPSMIALRKKLQDLQALSFMSEKMPNQPPIIIGSRPILWDSHWLKTAQRLTDDYMAFTSNDAMRFPPALAFTVELAAFDQTSQRVDVALAAAARPAERVMSGQYQVEAELQQLTSVSQSLIGLGEQLRDAKIEMAANHLRDVVLSQADRLLAAVDAMASGQILLAKAPTFDWWDGSMPLATRTFREPSSAELAVEVDSSRENITKLANNYAQPLVRILTSHIGNSGNRELAARWQGIIRAVGHYERKDRDSSLRRLEQFILTDMDQIDPANCANIANTPPTPGNDLFAMTLDEMKLALGKRCAALGSNKLRDNYASLQAQFNETLAGRFPFARDGGPTTPRADPLAVRRFFWAVQQEQLPARAIMDAALGRAASTFLISLSDTSKALAPMLVDPTLDQPLTYEVEADFRTNPGIDVGGNQIIEWGLDCGGDQWLSSREPKRSLIWSTGMPTRLFVRFARNAPSIPAPDPQGRYRVDGTMATWEASDPWALLSMMAPLTPDRARFAELPDRRPHVLELNLDLQRNPNAATGADTSSKARLYLRLGLTAHILKAGKPDEKVRVTLPQFPVAAPEIDLSEPIRLLPRER